MTQLDPDFKDLLSCFNSASVRYLLVGGYAVNFHGHHRNTKDLDLWIAISPKNAEAVSRALHAFGFGASAVLPDLFLQERRVYSFGRAPLRVDILTSPSGVEFDACYERRTEASIDGVTVPVISLKDLLANKIASGRPRDVDDSQQLTALAVHGGKPKQARRTRRSPGH